MTNKGETTVSSLIIPNAKMADSGVYSCQNGHGIDPVDVHVVVSPYGESEYPTHKNLKFWSLVRGILTLEGGIGTRKRVF